MKNLSKMLLTLPKLKFHPATHSGEVLSLKKSSNSQESILPWDNGSTMNSSKYFPKDLSLEI